MQKPFRTKTGIDLTIAAHLVSDSETTTYLSVRATVRDTGEAIGRAAFFPLTNEPTSIWECCGDPGIAVDPAWRRCGIATAMFDLAYDVLGSRIRTSTDLTDDGHAFAEARARKTNRNRSRFCLAKATILIDERATQFACTREPQHPAPCGSRIHRTSTYGVWDLGENGRVVADCPW